MDSSRADGDFIGWPAWLLLMLGLLLLVALAIVAWRGVGINAPITPQLPDPTPEVPTPISPP